MPSDPGRLAVECRKASHPPHAITPGPFRPELAPHEFVFDHLARWGAERPDQLAIVASGWRLTYREVENRTNQLARVLRARGVKRGDSVALVLPRGVETILAIVGVLKAGAAYVPLDSEIPAERLQMCLEDAAPSIVVGTAEAASLDCDAVYLSLEQLVLEARRHSPDGLPHTEISLDSTDLAYIIFTSGTTGRPKGVPITHRSLTNFVRGNQEACIRVEPHDRVFQGFSPASDGHHEEVWPTFMAGATLVVATTDDVQAGPELGAFLETHAVSIISCAPTLLSMVEKDVPSLRRVLFGAERCPPDLVRRWWRPGREIINTYGPTEATVGTTFAYCSPDTPITIGRPLPNYFCYILNERQEPVAAGAEGELCISGIGVSPGYIGEAKNNQSAAGRFLANPFAVEGEHNDLLYRTGDRARLAPDGTIEWLGRIDSQVKIRGYRIELSDIETYLLDNEAVRSACVIVRGAETPAPKLVALLVSSAGANIEIGRLAAHLRDELPSYMIPHVFESVEALPVLPSGKIDRKRAQQMEGLPLTLPRVVDEPRTENERRVAGLWQSLFQVDAVSRDDDFFTDLGGYSLLAAQFVSSLRNAHGIARVSVRDLYDNPTLARFARKLDDLQTREEVDTPDVPDFAPVPRGRYAVATVLQGLGILFLFGFRACFWLSPVVCAAYAVWLDWTPVKSVMLGLFVHMASVPLGLLLVVALKWLVIGRIQAGKYPVWGGYFLRWWFVQRLLDIAPRVYITGTPLASLFLRALGARVGSNVIIESLEMDCPDLMAIGDDCVLEERSWVRASHVAHGYLSIRPISIGRGCIIGVRSGVAGGAVLGEGAFLQDLSCAVEGTIIPPHEEWAGSPAQRTDPAEPTPAYDPEKQPSRRRLVWFGLAQALLVLVMPLVDMIPFLSAALLLYQLSDDWQAYLLSPLYGVLLILAVMLQILLVKWAVVGKMKPGKYRVPSNFYLRRWFVDKLLEIQTAVIVPIYDTLYTRPWCIALGMKCGPRSEVAMPARLPFDLVELGEENFLCSDCAVGMPLRRNGDMVLEKTITAPRVFLGNDSVIRQGARMPADTLLGALSVSPPAEELGTQTGQSWLGSPSFRLPSRQRFDQFDVEQTYRPTRRLYAERLVHETLRIILPTVASLVVATLMLNAFDVVWDHRGLRWAILTTPFIDLLAAVGAAVCLLLAKKLLIGKYKPTIQPLWSRFVWKTETFAMFFHDFAGQLFVSTLLGTPYMAIFLRFMGAKVGRRAFIDTFDLTEFDLLSIGEDTAINFNAPLQAHLFEDRVMKMGRISIGDRCSVGISSVVLFDSVLENDSHVGHISLIMKGETIPSGTYWTGSPAQVRTAESLPDPSLIGAAL